MKVTMDKAGRIVIPKKIREQAGLEPGWPLELSVCDGVVQIEPKSVNFHLEQEGGFLVLVPDEEIPPITVEDVERMRQEIYQERAREFMGRDP